MVFTEPRRTLACYRDPDLPQKPLNEVQDAADFVTIRVPKDKLGS
jgi:hypothetical protein